MRTLKLSVLGLLLCAAAAVVALDGRDARALSRGPFLEHSNAPGEANCTQCHRTYPLDSGQGRVEILGLPEQYAPSETYPVTVRVSDPGAHEWGFQITAVTDDGAACGFFETQDFGVQALGPSQRYGRFYAEHTILGVYAGQFGSAEWHFLWKAPSTDLGPAHFYACGNAANGDHTDFYDYIYSTALTIDGQKKNVRVTLVAPTTGDRLGAGERADIRWTATTGDDASPAAFSILLSTDGGASYPTVIASDLPADARSYVWQVPDALATSTARIRVVGLDTAGAEHADESRSDLAIGPLGLDRRAEGIAFPAGAPARRAAWADFDGDGRPDAAIARAAGGALLLRQTADGGFEDVSTASGVSGLGDARAVAWADFDADGRPDLAVVSPSSIAIYHNDGEGHFSDVGAPTPLPRPGDPRAVAWADVDGDGRPDLLVAAGSGLVAIRNAPTGFEDATALWGAPAGATNTVAAGPLVALGRDDGLVVLRFEGGRFADATAETGAALAGPVRALVWADATGDGTLDLVAATGAGLRVLAGAGGDGARYDDATALIGLDAGGDATDVAAGDYDADGQIDLFAVVGGVARVFRGRAAGFSDVSARFSFDAGTLSAAWVDVDGSGAEDLVAVAPAAATLLTNPRSGGSAVRVRAAAGAIVRVDLDGDGVWATGAKVARIADVSGVLVDAPGATTVRVRADFASGGLETTASVGGAALTVTAPPAPPVASVRLAGARLVVDGSGLPTAAAIEVGGVALDRVKAPARFVSGGTTSRLVGRDAALGALVAARPVVVRVLDPATGVLTAPVLLR